MKITVVGLGNVGSTFAKAIGHHTSLELFQVVSTNKKRANALHKQFGCLVHHHVEQIDARTELIILAVTDSKIPEVSAKIPKTTQYIVTHCSGATHAEVLSDHARYGILYPLYSFPNARKRSFRNIPLLVHSVHIKDEQRILEVANQLSDKTYIVDDTSRQHLHIAAVFANNFANHIMARAFEWLSLNQVSKEILLPIVLQSTRNWAAGLAKEIQSGPALRHDIRTLDTHRALLESRKEFLDLYDQLTKSIQTFYTDENSR